MLVVWVVPLTLCVRAPPCRRIAPTCCKGISDWVVGSAAGDMNKYAVAAPRQAPTHRLVRVRVVVIAWRSGVVWGGEHYSAVRAAAGLRRGAGGRNPQKQRAQCSAAAKALRFAAGRGAQSRLRTYC